MSTNEKSLEARIAELEATVQRLTAGPGNADENAGCSERPVNRRTMLHMAVAAAGGAVVAPLMAARPAAAENGNAIAISQTNTTTLPVPNVVGSGGANTVLIQGPGPAPGFSRTHFQVEHSATDPQPTGVLTAAPLWGTGSTDGQGVMGWAPGAAGYGVYGTSDSGVGVAGQSATGSDIRAVGTGRISQIANFTATGSAPAFTPGNFEMVRDSQGVVWISGGPETGSSWRRNNSVIPITPVRVWDSRNPGGSPGDGPAAPPGAIQGPFNAVTTLELTLGGYRTLPTAISGLLCVLTVITPTSGGFIRAYPAGVAAPLAVVGNYPAGAIQSFYPTVAVGTSGPNAGKLAVQIAMGTGVHVGLDITGYLM